MKTCLKTLCWLALALGAESVMANTMRCGDTVIDDEQEVPATAAQVLAACGEPTSRADGQWTYEQEGQFTKILEFDSDGNLQSISDQSATD
jgi:Protein of unknown function (DUF2845)